MVMAHRAVKVPNAELRPTPKHFYLVEDGESACRGTGDQLMSYESGVLKVIFKDEQLIGGHYGSVQTREPASVSTSVNAASVRGEPSCWRAQLPRD